MSRRHADIWSNPGPYLVDPYAWPWSPNNQDHIWPWKFKCQGHGQGQTHWSHLMHGVQSIFCFSFRSNRTTFRWDIANSTFDFENSRSRWWPRSNLMVTFESQGSIDISAFRFVAIGPFWERYSKFHIWPWNVKVKVMVKVKPDGHIWGLEFNRCVCFSFRGNRTIFGWDIANSILNLKIQGQGHDQNWPKSNQVIYRSGPAIVEKWQKSKKLFKSYRVNKNLRPAAAAAAVAAYEPVQKYKVTPGIPGWLN